MRARDSGEKRYSGDIRVDVVIIEGDEARMWEIAENLHRADLTKLERGKQIKRWMTLADTQPSHVETAVLSDGRRAGPQHRPSGVNAAVRDLGIERNEAQRAHKIAGIMPEAKKAAVAAGIGNQ